MTKTANNPSLTQGEVILDLRPSSLVGPILSRVAAMVAARCEFPIDRVQEIMLLADTVAAHGPNYALEEGLKVILAGDRQAGSLKLRVGPLREGGGEELLKDAELPDIGNVVNQLATGVEIEFADGSDFLNLSCSKGA